MMVEMNFPIQKHTVIPIRCIYLKKEKSFLSVNYLLNPFTVQMYCYNVLREPLLALLLDRLKNCLESNSAWQPLEACLHCFLAVAESVGIHENQHLPLLYSTLQSIPYSKLNVRVAITMLDVIGKFDSD